MLYIFAYVFFMFAAPPSPIMEAAFGHLHNGGPAAFGRLHSGGPAASGRRPTIVEAHYGGWEGGKYIKNIRNTYKIYACLRILSIL